MKNTLIRLSVAAPVTGGALVLLMMLASGKQNLDWKFFVVALVGFFLLGLQTWANYFRQWHDPALALKYWDIFCAEDLEEQRKKACSYFLKYKRWSIEVEDVLDVLDDLGFYVQTIHVSRDVLHQYFYWWIRGYVVLADSYIAEKRSGNVDKKEPADPTRWEHCKLLLEQVSKVEAERFKAVNVPNQNLEWSEDQKMRFLKEEAGKNDTNDETA